LAKTEFEWAKYGDAKQRVTMGEEKILQHDILV
jgi:hypothetical protein